MTRRGKQPLRFYDHSRQRYADKVPLGNVGEFLIGDYNGDGTVSHDGEFRVALIDMTVNGRWGLYPYLEAFGDGVGSLHRAIDAGLLDALARGPVDRAEEFVPRLLEIGFVVFSDRVAESAQPHDGRRRGLDYASYMTRRRRVRSQQNRRLASWLVRGDARRDPPRRLWRDPRQAQELPLGTPLAPLRQVRE